MTLQSYPNDDAAMRSAALSQACQMLHPDTNLKAITTLAAGLLEFLRTGQAQS